MAHSSILIFVSVKCKTNNVQQFWLNKKNSKLNVENISFFHALINLFIAA